MSTEAAKWEAARLLRLTRVPEGSHESYDASDSAGKRFRIKCRTGTPEESTSFDFRHENFLSLGRVFDELVCVFQSHDGDILAVYRVPYEVVRELGVQNRDSFRFRWNRKVAGDKRIGSVSRARRVVNAGIRGQV